MKNWMIILSGFVLVACGADIQDHRSEAKAFRNSGEIQKKYGKPKEIRLTAAQNVTVVPAVGREGELKQLFEKDILFLSFFDEQECDQQCEAYFLKKDLGDNSRCHFVTVMKRRHMKAHAYGLNLHFDALVRRFDRDATDGQKILAIDSDGNFLASSEEYDFNPQDLCL